MMILKKKSKILIRDKYIWYNKETSITKKEFSENNYERLKKHWFINLIDSGNSKYLAVDSLIETNDLITGSSNIILRKVIVKPHRFDKLYMDKDLIEDKLYQIINQFNERKIMSAKFYSVLLNQINPFFDGNV